MRETTINTEHVNTIKEYLLDLQHRICVDALKLEACADGVKQFNEDVWQREQGGGGITRVIEGGKIFEKAGVNFSHIRGDHLPSSASALRPELAGRSFEAMGVSVVMHPDNPFVPTSHANVRFFIAYKEGAEPIWWFGGGFDLTPYYVFEEDARAWHQHAHALCKPFNELIQPDVYAHYKAICDEYFYLKHRDEARGIGGLFVDDLNTPDLQVCFDFIKAIGNGYINAYVPIVERRWQHDFGQQHKAFQAYRRGRYVEFNLVFDRGTLFGLQSGGRTESILMSLPPVVNWKYDYQVPANSPEAQLQNYLKPRDWLHA